MHKMPPDLPIPRRFYFPKKKNNCVSFRKTAFHSGRFFKNLEGCRLRSPFAVCRTFGADEYRPVPNKLQFYREEIRRPTLAAANTAVCPFSIPRPVPMLCDMLLRHGGADCALRITN